MQAAQSVDVGPDTAALTPADRQALARLWSVAARSGWQDVPALAELAVVLAALGAPRGLVGRAAGCAGEQAVAADAALRLAEAYAGAPLVLAPPVALLSRPPGGVRRPRRALRRLAVRALRDGCLVGGHVAQVTCWASATSADPAVRTALAVVTAAETRAAAVWSDVLDWSLLQRPRLLRRLRAVDLVETSPLAALVAGVGGDPAVLAAHGWPRPDQLARLWAVHRAGVVARLGRPQGVESPSAPASAAAHWA